jgi:hypothetical protein
MQSFPGSPNRLLNWSAQTGSTGWIGSLIVAAHPRIVVLGVSCWPTARPSLAYNERMDGTPETLQIHCETCGGAVKLQFSGRFAPMGFQQGWVCPYCRQERRPVPVLAGVGHEGA